MATFSFGSLQEAVGTDLGRSGWIDIPQARIDAFAETTEDRQWIHVDPERAAQGPFGTTIAHGYLTLSLVSAFIEEIFVVEGARLAINYGLNNVRFPSAVSVNSRVRGRGELVDVRTMPGWTQATVRLTVETEGGEKPACVADILIRYPANKEEH